LVDSWLDEQPPAIRESAVLFEAGPGKEPRAARGRKRLQILGK